MPIRTQIRTALAGTAATVQGIAASSILLGRRRTIPTQKLPAICIYTDNEQKTIAHISDPLEFDRILDIMFEIHVQAATPAAAEIALDALTQKLETAILANETLNGLVRETSPVSDEYNIEEDAAATAAVALCRYTITYTA